jgi:tRNA pseudouridine38-40 synthase
VSSPLQVRFRLTLQYDGSPFCGWQLQPQVPTVQGAIETVIEQISGSPRRVIGSGRTDSGVHALHQVAAVDLPPGWTAVKLRTSLNALLPRAIWVQEVRRVHEGFHPRFDARERSYLYRVGTQPEASSPFHRRWCWIVDDPPPDPELLVSAAHLIPGERSFRRFAKVGQAHRGERCHVRDARWEPWGELGWEFRIQADRYLHHMVRYLVGTMVEVALGRRPLDEFRTLLNDPGTTLVTSPPAPPEGLFLSRVRYDALPDDLTQDCDPPSETP